MIKRILRGSIMLQIPDELIIRSVEQNNDGKDNFSMYLRSRYVFGSAIFGLLSNCDSCLLFQNFKTYFKLARNTKKVTNQKKTFLFLSTPKFSLFFCSSNSFGRNIRNQLIEKMIATWLSRKEKLANTSNHIRRKKFQQKNKEASGRKSSSFADFANEAQKKCPNNRFWLYNIYAGWHRC